MAGYTPLEWLALVEHELLLFAGVFFLIGALDDLAIDGLWLWLKARGRAITPVLARSRGEDAPLAGRAAVLIPAWQEADVVGATVAHALAAWPQADLRLYIGCYRNDPDTIAAVLAGSGGDPRVRVVVHDAHGPTTKGDCLNRLYAALSADEAHSKAPFRTIVLHDAEDMVDPAALPLLDRAIADAEFVQLPVLPQVQAHSRWIGSHYCEEFAEAHGKALVVREAVGAGLPAAGVGCALDRVALRRLEGDRTGSGPFPRECLTEDYELGLRIAEFGGRSRFLRVRGDDGHLVATRAFFPDTLSGAVRQKTRWVHGIAFQGWDRMGWGGGMAERWMRLRDRRGPLTAIVLLAAYCLVVVSGLLALLQEAGVPRPWETSPAVQVLVIVNLVIFAWRAVLRFLFTAREYGWAEGLRAVARIPLANVVAIMAGRRALLGYVRSLRGELVAWDKTSHAGHPSPPPSWTGQAQPA